MLGVPSCKHEFYPINFSTHTKKEGSVYKMTPTLLTPSLKKTSAGLTSSSRCETRSLQTFSKDLPATERSDSAVQSVCVHVHGHSVCKMLNGNKN